MPLDEFIAGVASPLARSKPDCRLLAAQHLENPYQQVPLPGVNCKESVQPKANEPPNAEPAKPLAKTD